MSIINTQLELERLSEKLAERFASYQRSIAEHAPTALSKKLWQFVQFTQLELEVVNEEVERKNHENRDRPFS